MISAGGTSVLEQGRTTPLAALGLSATWPAPSQQDRLAKIGPVAGFDFEFLRQHLPPWQQVGVESVKVLAAIGAKEAKENRNAVYAATMLRMPYQPCFAPSIPGTTLYHAPAAPRSYRFRTESTVFQSMRATPKLRRGRLQY